MDFERQYLDLISHVAKNGDYRMDRTSVGTRSVFGAMIRADLSDGSFPALTTKRVYWKTAVREMLWFLSGKTNIQDLLKDEVHIWSEWPHQKYVAQTSDQISLKDFEQRILGDDAFAAQWGDLGPVYGKQWRQWKGPDGKTYDQIAKVIETLKTNPSSRRMLFHAWNVAELSDMALPPCHMVYQLHTDSRNRLNMLTFQRSVDLFLGLSFNWIGMAAIQAMIAQQAGLEVGDIVWMAGDAHVYMNHLDQVEEQLSREPRPLPKLHLKKRATSIDDYRIEDFKVTGYDPHPPIKAPVAV